MIMIKQFNMAVDVGFQNYTVGQHIICVAILLNYVCWCHTVA